MESDSDNFDGLSRPIQSGNFRDTEMQPGTIVAGRYRIDSVIGRGSTGTVYKCQQVFLGKEVALKVLESQEVSKATLQRFQQEARAIFAIEHPNLIAVHDFGLIEERIPFLAMDYVRGKSLADELKARGALSVEDAVPVFLRICFGLAYAHARGVVHRDLKPSNIMLVDGVPREDEGCVRIVDFGIAKITDRDGFHNQALTKTGEVIGSPIYMSPEQCKGGPVDQRSDIYSLGCVLFETLTGTPPYIGSNEVATMVRHLESPQPTLKEASLGKNFPVALERILAAMLEKDTNTRYQRISEVAADLSEFQQGVAPNHNFRYPVPSTSQTKQAPNPKHISISLPRLCILVALLIAVTALASSAVFFIVSKTIAQKQQELVIASPIAKTKRPLSRQQANPAESATGGEIFSYPEITGAELEAALSNPEDPDKVSLKFRKLTDREFRRISEFSGLKQIDLGNTQISNSGIRHLISLKRMFHITLSGTNFDDSGARLLSQCSYLHEVELANTNVSGAGIECIAQLPCLNSLGLEGTKGVGQSLKALAHAKRLKWLSLRGAGGIDSATIKSLAKSRLAFLSLENTAVDDAAVETLHSMPDLITIAIGGTKISTDGIQRLLRNSNIMTVYCVDCPKISQSDLEILKKKFAGVSFKACYHAGNAVD